MGYLRRLQVGNPLLFWLVVVIAFWVAFRLALHVVGLVIGPFGLPPWAPIGIVLLGLVVVARRQQR